jgi:mono/diheme cytochrome c family protein
VPDPGFGSAADRVESSLPPVHHFGAHTAPLGIGFYTDRAFPARYREAAFVPLHGSWNRSTKVGYSVVALFFGADGNITEEDFATGFEVDEDVSGRPVDVAVGPDGALYVSDDYAGAIYRIAYGAPAAVAGPAPAPEARAKVTRTAGGVEMDPRLRNVALDQGRQLWAQHQCASCHEEDGGAEIYRPLTALGRKYDLNSMMTFLKTPQPPMPVFPMTEFERRDLSTFLLDRYP